MRIHVLAFESGGAFLDFLAGAEDGWLRAPTRAAFSDGESILVEFRFPELGHALLIGAQVAAGDVPDTLWIRLDPAERATLDLLVRTARGDVTSAIDRRYRRYPIALEVTWLPEGAGGPRRRGRTTDISASGCFVETALPPSPGARVDVEVTFPTGEALRFDATVVRARSSALGMGLVFDPASPDRATLRAELRKCEERGSFE